MKIGIIHYKVGDTDGVSLEIDKWKTVLENLGHEVFLAGGYLGTASGTLIKEMFHHGELPDTLYRQTFVKLEPETEPIYRQKLLSIAAKIEEGLEAFIENNQIELLIVENIWSVSANPAAAIATAHVVSNRILPCIAHHHDFYWERIDGVCLTCSTAVELADKYLPPHSQSIVHTVINSLALGDLLERKGIRSRVIPNIFDFDGPPWIRDEYNADLRERIGLTENDIVVLQATRVVTRKGIELAVDFVKALSSPSRRRTMIERGLYNGRPFREDSRIVLIMAGYQRDDTFGTYTEKINQKIQQAGIDAMFISEIVDADRSTRNGEKIYSLWDTYVIADLVSYPSLWEGWGNQLLEAVRARTPFLLFEYPVYQSDIAKADFRAISLGDQIQRRDALGLVQVSQEVIDAAADEAVEYLCDSTFREQNVAHNFEQGQKYFNLEALEVFLKPLIAEAVIRRS